MNRIEVSHLIKNYGSNEVLKDLDLTVGNNEVVVMIGPSGSGKSTFLRCLNRLEEPTSGEIIVDGYNLSDRKSDLNQIREKIGMVFQHFNLFKNLTVAENITLAPVELGKMTPEEAKETAKHLLETVGLSDKYDAKPSSLSGGQKQRIAIARALLSDTEVVIFDEATSNLDQLTEKKIYDNLRSTNKTQIIITHRLSSIRDTDYIYVLNRGSIIEQGTHLDLMKKKGWYFESIQ